MFLHFPSFRIDKKVIVIGKHDFAYSLYHFQKRTIIKRYWFLCTKYANTECPLKDFWFQIWQVRKNQKLGNSLLTYQIKALGKLIGMDQFKLGISGFQIWKIWRILKEGKRHDTYYYRKQCTSSLYRKFHVNSSLCHPWYRCH